MLEFMTKGKREIRLISFLSKEWLSIADVTLIKDGVNDFVTRLHMSYTLVHKFIL